MGIDIYMAWDGMTEEDKQKQYTGMSTTSGEVGYLREAYHGGPYATKILCREAFEADTCKAQIPAAVLRERLTYVTEPCLGANGGHIASAMLCELMRGTSATVGSRVLSGETTPMTVEEAVRERYKRLYPDAEASHVDEVVQSFRAFVALAECKECETGKPCTIYASY